MANQKQTTPATEPATTVQAEARAQWASERARLAATGIGAPRGGNGRFARMADMLAVASVEGETSISFAQCNSRMGSNRIEGPAGAASWRTLLQRFAQVDPEGAAWRVDAEKGAIVRRDPK
jgi:hypothetical protein